MPQSNLSDLWNEFSRTPFPRLGVDVGLVEYDADIAGCALRASRGETINASMLPSADQELVSMVAWLRTSASRSPEEEQLLQYFDLLERVRNAISSPTV